jgi:hypothetical protein
MVEIGLGIFVFQDLVREADIERAAAECNSRGQGQALDDGLDHLVPVLLDYRRDYALQERADEQRALVAPRHLPRPRHALRPNVDVKSGRQFDALKVRVELRHRHRQGRTNRTAQSLLVLVLVAIEPVWRRMFPEIG